MRARAPATCCCSRGTALWKVPGWSSDVEGEDPRSNVVTRLAARRLLGNRDKGVLDALSVFRGQVFEGACAAPWCVYVVDFSLPLSRQRTRAGMRKR
jgi:hypothetical protein